MPLSLPPDHKPTGRSHDHLSQQTQQHVRNDSIYSMDSFVADMSETNERYGEGHDELGADESDPKFEYISPSSSSVVSNEHSNKLDRKISALSSTETISDQHDLESNPRRNDERTVISRGGSLATDGELTVGSDSSGPVPPPVHSFFNQPYFQTGVSAEDGGDGGSLVFNYSHESSASSQQQRPPNPMSQNTNTGQQQNQKYNPPTRDRFPSFDSVGSSGSLVRHFPGGQGSKAPITQTSTNATSVPRILPYHERRKLQQQQRSQGSNGPPRPDRQQSPYPSTIPNIPPSTAYSPFPIPPNPQHQPPFDQQPSSGDLLVFQQQNPFLLGGLPGYPPNVPIPFPPYSSVSVPPPIGTPIHPGFLGMYPPPPFPMQHPPTQFDRTQNPFRPGSALPDRPPPSGNGPNSASKSKLPVRVVQPHPSNAKIRPTQLSYQQQAQQRMGSMQEHIVVSNNDSSTFDSSDENGEMKETGSTSIYSVKRGTSPPPPPPPVPPPPLKAAHVRQNSNGSVSSLGSLDRSIREDITKEQTTSTSRNFFQRWNPWSSKRNSVTDFHRKNQAFLSSVGKQGKSNTPTKTIPTSSSKVPVRRTPPPSRGGHRRLTSIDNDDWTEPENGESDANAQVLVGGSTNTIPSDIKATDVKDLSTLLENGGFPRGGEVARLHEDSDSISSNLSSSHTGDEVDRNTDERTRLLPPTGISSNEQYDRRHYESTDKVSNRSGKYKRKHGLSHDPDLNRQHSTARPHDLEKPNFEGTTGRREKKSKKHRRRQRRSTHDESQSSSSISSSTTSSRTRPQKMSKRVVLLEKERKKLFKQWKAEASAEAEAKRKLELENRWYRRLASCFSRALSRQSTMVMKRCQWLESLFANMPLTIGSIAIANATLGVDWFKFTEENLVSCRPVHFHSVQCTFPEFPGCFYCDTSAKPFMLALLFHRMCSTFAGILALCFFAKLFVARRVFFDELSSPTMAAPAGNVCVTLVIVFAGQGTFGMFAVLAASSIHLCLAMWFIYMALAYHMMPDPSWFPNTTSIGICAVKTWLYNPIAGQLLMAISLSLNFLLFPVSLVRVLFNNKISAPVSWMQMSAPDISLYALTIMGQPSFEEELPDINNFQKVHRMVYLPIMHFLFVLCIIGMAASLHGLRARWKEFRKLRFSPAHAAFCAPTLSHANAVQAYRAAINSFSNFPPDGLFRKCLYTYWITVLMCGTILTVYITIRFLINLPEWTHIDVEGEIEPPAPNETSMTLTNMVSAGETLVQPYVSPAVLQANETGTLVLVNDARGHRYVRTRQITAIGFDPILNVIQIERERDLLLDWVGKNPPRSRSHTLSVPGIDFNYGSTFGTGNSGVYDCDDINAPWTQRPRSPLYQFRRTSTLNTV